MSHRVISRTCPLRTTPESLETGPWWNGCCSILPSTCKVPWLQTLQPGTSTAGTLSWGHPASVDTLRHPETPQQKKVLASQGVRCCSFTTVPTVVHWGGGGETHPSPVLNIFFLCGSVTSQVERASGACKHACCFESGICVLCGVLASVCSQSCGPLW